MKRESTGVCLSAMFVDYDNIYFSLKRKDEEAAKRFAKDPSVWVREIESGRLITAAGPDGAEVKRRIVMNRCYGNPVPRKKEKENANDMCSFPFVRHHFLRSGFEVIDCPPLTSQLKNSSDIRIVMDVCDFLTHNTHFDEFIVLSGDADFTPVLHRLRSHARRTIIFANEYTASPYTAICDGEVREQDLLKLLLGARVEADEPETEAMPVPTPAQRSAVPGLDIIRKQILAEVLAGILATDRPVPIETLADRAQRALGHERTVGSNWAGHGTFRAFLDQTLPEGVRLTDQAPFLAYRTDRPAPAEVRPARAQSAPQMATNPAQPKSNPPIPTPAAPPIQQPASTQDLHRSIARIHEACQVPPLAPPEYRTLFEAMAAEISANGLSGAQTISNIAAWASERGLSLRRDDIRFVLDVVSEADPWFEQGASANLFAGRFRNFAVARCRSQGLSLSISELDLIDAWFASGPVGPSMLQRHAATPNLPPLPADQEILADSNWLADQSRRTASELLAGVHDELAADGDMPRIIRSRQRA